jgi:hypothetical protein
MPECLHGKILFAFVTQKNILHLECLKICILFIAKSLLWKSVLNRLPFSRITASTLLYPWSTADLLRKGAACFHFFFAVTPGDETVFFCFCAIVICEFINGDFDRFFFLIQFISTSKHFEVVSATCMQFSPALD